MGNVSYQSWVPKPVTDFVESVLHKPHDAPSLARLQLLVESPDMHSAWKSLYKAATDPDHLVEFVRSAAFSPWLSWGQHLLPTSTPAQQRLQFRKIAQTSRDLLKQLQALGEGRAEGGAQLLVSAAQRAVLAAFSKPQHEQLSRYMALAFPAQWSFGTKVTSPLQWLHETAIVAAGAPSPPGPRKLGSKNALRTAYVLELAGFVRNRFKKPLFAVVATTANVMFNEFDSPLTPDHVRKLILPSKKISGKKLE